MSERCKIVGAHFRPPAKHVVACLKAEAPLYIEPEPENQYDRNALKVMILTEVILTPEYCDQESLSVGIAQYGYSVEDLQKQDSWQLGYIPRDLAEGYAPQIGNGLLDAKVGFALDGTPQAVFDLPDSPLVSDDEIEEYPFDDLPEGDEEPEDEGSIEETPGDFDSSDESSPGSSSSA